MGHKNIISPKNGKIHVVAMREQREKEAVNTPKSYKENYFFGVWGSEADNLVFMNLSGS